MSKTIMPPEWATHERTLIEWPVLDSVVWPENYDRTCLAYKEVVEAIAKYEPVTLIVNEDTMERAQALCGSLCDYIIIPHNDAWVRDNGPTFVYDETGKRFGISWKFNAWGEKYLPYDLDDAVAETYLRAMEVPVIEVDLVLEGGSIHVDGEGTLLTTKECLLNPNRNPSLTMEAIEEKVHSNLGLTKTIWLERGLYGDETDGHIDNIACFIEPGVILLQVCHDVSDPNHEITQENRRILSNAIDAKGRQLKVIEIEGPPARYYQGERLTLSYLNYYLVNGGVILPIFGGDAEVTDQAAIKLLQDIYPERTIETIDGMGLIPEGGNVHCITQQVIEKKEV